MFESCGYNSTLMVFLDLVECQLAKPLTFSPKVKYWQWADVQGNDGQSKVFKNTSCNNMPPSILHIESIYLLHFLHLYNGFQDYCNFYATIFWYVVLLHNSIPACSGPRTTPITSKIRYMPTYSLQVILFRCFPFNANLTTFKWVYSTKVSSKSYSRCFDEAVNAPKSCLVFAAFNLIPCWSISKNGSNLVQSILV